MATQTPASLISTTNVWDTSQLYSSDFGNKDDLRELFVRLYQNINNIVLVLNQKDTGCYFLQEFINSQVFFPNPTLSSSSSSPSSVRQVYRYVMNFGALPNTGTTSVAHGLTMSAIWSATRIYGASTDTSGLNYIPLPYASPTAANNIELKIDATNVTIITGSNRSAFTKTYVVFEYLKS